MRNIESTLYTELFINIRRHLRYKIDNQVSNKVDGNLVVGIWGKLYNLANTPLDAQLAEQLKNTRP